MRGDASRVAAVRSARSIRLPLIVLAELRAGFAAGSRESSNAANPQRFLASSGVSVLLPDEQTAHHHAQPHLHLRGKGTAMPTDDLWIAAPVVQHGLVLCTSDRHFRRLLQS